MEAKKAEWTALQLDIGSEAIFTDDDLSFRVSHDAAGEDQCFVDPDPPEVFTVRSRIEGLHTVGGMDISFFKGIDDEAIATLTVLSFPYMVLLDSITHHIRLDAPYIPSFLAMREAHHFVSLIDELRGRPGNIAFPQVFLVDGNGRLHERQAGLATVVGVLAGVPTIGCAKDYHPLQNTKDNLPDWRRTQKGFKNACKLWLHTRGEWIGISSPNISGGYVGAALLASPDPKATVPTFVSPGHRVCLQTATAIALACSRMSRVPEPVRLADSISRRQVEKTANEKTDAARQVS